MQPKTAGIALCFLIVFASGIWLTRSGKPYSGILLNVHKLIALAGVVLLALVIRQTGRAARLSPTEVAIAVATGVLLVVSIVTGGLVSIDKPMPRSVLIVHRVAPFLAGLATGATVYLLANSG